MEIKESTQREAAIARRRAPDFTDLLIEPFAQFRTEVDRLFDTFPLRLPSLRSSRLTMAAPALEMTEADDGYRITAELPGLAPDQVDVTYEDGVLRIAGEKKEEREENERGYRFSERSYGAFERAIELPSAADGEGISAKFKHGLLTVSVPKAKDAVRKARKIPISKEV